MNGSTRVSEALWTLAQGCGSGPQVLGYCLPCGAFRRLRLAESSRGRNRPNRGAWSLGPKAIHNQCHSCKLWTIRADESRGKPDSGVSSMAQDASGRARIDQQPESDGG